MTVKSIFQDALTKASSYAQAAMETIKWTGREISNGFNSQVILRINSAYSLGLDKLNNFSQVSRSFIATPAGKIAAGITLTVITAVSYRVWTHVKAKRAASEKAKSAEVKKPKANQTPNSPVALAAKNEANKISNETKARTRQINQEMDARIIQIRAEAKAAADKALGKNSDTNS